MKVTHFNFSLAGGAGFVARNLASAQTELGHESIVETQVSSDLRHQPWSVPTVSGAAILDEYLISKHSKPTLVSPLRNLIQGSRLDLGKVSGAIHLHWVVGVFNTNHIESALISGQKLLWTMHDMAPFTGGCHHSFECNEFEDGCVNCPQVRSGFRGLVNNQLLQKKRFTKFANSGQLKIIAPSKWMENKLKDSAVFEDAEVRVIQNPIANDFFLSSDLDIVKSSKDKSTIKLACVAANLRDPNKNIHFAVNAYRRLVAALGPNKNTELVLVGNGGKEFESELENIRWLGPLEQCDLARVAKETSLLLSFSKAESAGMTVREFAAAGCPSIAIQTGVQGEFITSGKTGFLASNENEAHRLLMDAVQTIGSERFFALQKNAYVEAHKQNSSLEVARQYLEIYEEN